MFHYEFEKRPPSAGSCDSRATMTNDWSRVYPNAARACAGTTERARRPLPPRPVLCEPMPNKTTVPLKVWIIASASCFAVCAALVVATIAITKWGVSERYSPRELFDERPEPVYSSPNPEPKQAKTTQTPTTGTESATTYDEIDNEIQFPILEKLSIFKNIVANRDKPKKFDKDLGLESKPQLHPLHDAMLHHPEKKIEKKDQAKLPDDIGTEDKGSSIPEFRPTLPDVFINRHLEIKLPDGYVAGVRKHDLDYFEEYNDENLYDDYMQSNTVTSYLIEKVQELHDWIVTDPDFEAANSKRESNEFGQLLKALNDSLVEGNVSIVMSQLKDIYFGENYTKEDRGRKVIISNSTDLLSFGILTLDVMLLHNIQLMAWENQESARSRMMRDPDVFAFNALFLDPAKVEAKQNDMNNRESGSLALKRQNLRQESEDFDFSANLLENVLEIGMSTARAAIHLGRAYKNTKTVLNLLTNKDNPSIDMKNQLPRNVDVNAHALKHLKMSFTNDSSSVANNTSGYYTELDCVWLLYCKNLAATAKLNAPYGTMARINGMALRMLTGELSADKAFDTMLYEALTGWTELKCTDMFPRCSKVNAASVVMDSILQPLKKTQAANKTR